MTLAIFRWATIGGARSLMMDTTSMGTTTVNMTKIMIMEAVVPYQCRAMLTISEELILILVKAILTMFFMDSSKALIVTFMDSRWASNDKLVASKDKLVAGSVECLLAGVLTTYSVEALSRINKDTLL
mmetsp:Transcript_119491/g.211165  ORF Transcript_119491/g.211165 Transcript_119491/m.211165 type:complete len:128 (-) Transcript_119491:381-764(-)